MRNTNRLLTVLLALVLSSAARAECDSGGCTGFVDQIYVEANGGLWLQTSGNEALLNCVPDSNVYLRLPGDAAKFKEIHALLLTAQAMGWQVRVRIIEGTNPCAITYVYINRQ